MKKFIQLLAASMMLLPMLASAHGPTRQSAEESVFINAAPEKVWAVIKDVSAMENWHPAVASTEMVDDKTRILTLNAEGNPTITNEIKKIDDEKMSLTYKITEQSVVKTIEFNSKETPYYSLPVNNYKATISVKAKDGGSEVSWKGKFYRSFMDNPPVPEGQSDAEAVEAVSAVYQAGLNNLKAMMEK
jgi:mxaD protein